LQYIHAKIRIYGNFAQQIEILVFARLCSCVPVPLFFLNKALWKMGRLSQLALGALWLGCCVLLLLFRGNDFLDPAMARFGEDDQYHHAEGRLDVSQKRAQLVSSGERISLPFSPSHHYKLDIAENFSFPVCLFGCFLT
jgi:hypothetical protein